MTWNENKTITVEPPKKPKKITGTRFGAVLDNNVWTTPFQAWCEITKTYNEPFVDTIYTRAGKTIEPKQQEYMRNAYAMFNLKTPEDIYGKDFFNKTFGDFFPNNKIFGGMWDAILTDKDGKPTAVIEFKTTKRVEDWETGVPEYYSLQAALYAYLLGVDDVYLVASFLEESDYEHPENFIPAAHNTVVFPYKLSEKYFMFNLYIEQAEKWWKEHIETGISPVYDEKKDADYLKALETKFVSPNEDLTSLLDRAERLNAEIEAVTSTVADKEKEYKTVTEAIKERLKEQMADDITYVTCPGNSKEWKLTKTETNSVDQKALAKDGLLDKYSVTKITYRLTNKVKE